jgi:hypothetical protein
MTARTPKNITAKTLAMSVRPRRAYNVPSLHSSSNKYHLTGDTQVLGNFKRGTASSSLIHTMSTLTPTRYIEILFRPDDRVAITLIKKGPDSKTTLDSKQRTIVASELIAPKWQRFLRAMDYHGYEIYCGMNPIRPNAFGRQKRDILEIRHIFLDFDEDGDNALKRLLARRDIPHPNITLNTSPHKYQTIWKVAGFSPQAAEDLLRSLTRDTGADIAVTDIARVLRIPGFHNHKYCPAHLVAAHCYHTNVLPQALFPSLDLTQSPKPVPKRQHHRKRSDGIDHSRSGVDFGHTLGWLQANVSHAEILDKLIAQRHDKANPEYYARKTLENAIRIYHAAQDVKKKQ